MLMELTFLYEVESEVLAEHFGLRRPSRCVLGAG